MNYFKAREQNNAPFVVFDLVAESLEELQDLGLENDPLVVDEDNLPSYDGSICHQRIFNGALVARDQAQIDAYILQSNEDKAIALNSNKKDDVDEGSFDYDGVTYPMDAASQVRYQAIFQLPASDAQIQTKTGVVTVASADIPAFKDAYYEAVKATTEPA